MPFFSGWYNMLHKFHDGSVLRTMTAMELVKVPVWNGNRTLDKAHAERIRMAVGADVNKLDSGYRIVHYMEPDTSGQLVKQSYLIDGQHRAAVLKDHFLNGLCEPDFPVVVTEKDVASETEAIEFFNAINNVKPQQWRTDPAILVNKYIVEMERRFNTKKAKMIRPGATRRPYLSVDKLRDALKLIADELGQEKASIEAFCDRVVEKNKALISSVESLKDTKNAKYYGEAEKVGFMLAVDPKMGWIREVI